jgi:hypothetical protein
MAPLGGDDGSLALSVRADLEASALTLATRAAYSFRP